LIALTLQEIRRLMVRARTLVHPSWDFIWHWSLWRRRHQARARYFHFKGRLALPYP
jgi:hypothetical protein